MAFISEGARRSNASLAAATSANGTQRNGTALTTNGMHLGTLVMECDCTIVTGSVVATFKPQVSNDNSTWKDIRPNNNAAPVTVTATGSTVLPIDPSAMSFKFVRATATLSGATTAGGDTTTVTVRWLQFDELTF